MSLTSEKIVQGLVSTAVARRSQAPLRLFIAVVLAISFRAELNIVWLWSWLGVYVAAQLFEIWSLWPFRQGAPAPPPWRTWAAMVAIFVLAAAFGAVAVPVWLVSESLGPAGAVLLLAGSILNVLSLSRGSPLAFMAGSIPYACYLLSAPLIDRAVHGSNPFSIPFILAEILFLVAAVLVFTAAERLATAQERATVEAQEQRAMAEASVQAKSAFVATVSHELRTPLGGLLAAAGDLHRRTTEPELRSRAAMVIQGARMMRAILDDLLDLSKLEAGRMQVESTPFDLQLLIEDVALFWSTEADRKQLALNLEGAERLPTAVEGDPLRLRQILNNLLSNAVKFTEKGGVRIACALHESGGRLILTIEVIDTGRGMSPEQAAMLFQPFEQGGASVARTHGGTGLGLAISRQLARLMGGDLTGDGSPGVGARFTLTTVLRRAASNALAAPEPAPPPKPVAARILAVDDHEIGRRTLGLLLEPLGAKTTLAAGGEEALEILAEQTFDLVLMDVTMQGMDGLETCRRLRASEGRNRTTPVVAVTGHTDPADVEACLAAGMSGWVAKPIEPRALFEAIDRALSVDAEGQIEAA